MKLLVTGAWPDARNQMDGLCALGHETVFLQQEKDPLPCDAAWPEGVICNGLFLHHSIEDFTHLRYIQLTSAGFDRVPMDVVRARGIEIRNARGVYSVPMAETAVMGALGLYRQAAFFQKNQQVHLWEKRRDLLELAGKTVCILGTGSVGMECAKRFRAFDCRVLGVNRTVRENPAFDEISPMERLPEILSETDVLVLTLPLSEQTHHLMNAEAFSNMKPGSILINIARGALVDTEALIPALRTRLLGAALDVFEAEPLPADSPLWELENVILTPHNSFVGDGNTKRLNDVIFRNLRDSKPVATK